MIENTEWVSQAGNPVAYAPHIRKSPLDGMQAKPVIIQFAKGDKMGSPLDNSVKTFFTRLARD